jgi:hypothetical protein
MLDHGSTSYCSYIECASCVKVQIHCFCVEHEISPQDLHMHVNLFESVSKTSFGFVGAASAQCRHRDKGLVLLGPASRAKIWFRA